MIVCNEGAIIERCLLAVKPYVHSWLIHDVGSTDNTARIIQDTLWDIPGRIENRPLGNFSTAKNDLLQAAQTSADLLLMINAEEEFQSLDQKVFLSDKIDVGLVDIIHMEYTTRIPRLFRSSCLPQFQYPVGENLVFKNQTQAAISGFAFLEHGDGVHQRAQVDTLAKRFLIESVIAGPTSNVAKNLLLGRLEIRKQELPAALKHLELIIQNAKHSPEFWHASYLAGNIVSHNGDNVRALQLFQDCFDFAPERAEPLMQMAELHHQHGEYQIAHDLCEIIIEMSIAPQADYFEPALYSYEALLLLAETALATQNHQSLISTIKTLDKVKGLPGEVSQRISELNRLAKSIKTEKTDSANKQLPVDDSEVDSPVITIGMATHDDFDGVYFSIISLVLYHKELLDQIEILVIDNNPGSVHGEAVRSLCRRVRQARYVPAGEYQGTGVRERVFAEAKGKLVVCMDCHVFLHAGAVARLIDYFKQNPNSKDLLHGPLFYDNHDQYSTHMDAEWNDGFFGRWASDPRGLDINGEPFDIPLQGMGLFACLKSSWLGFNPRFRGFGGEEGYIHEKFRQNGGRVLCLPFLRWTHRFDRPNAPSYPNRWQDRIRNYLIGWHELNLDYKPVLEHFSSHLNFSQAASAQASFLRELKGPLCAYNTQYFLCDSEQQWAAAQPSLRASGIENIVQRTNSIEQLEHLLTIAQASGIQDVVLIDARQQINSLTADISTVLEHLSRSPCDIITCKNSLDSQQVDSVSIIQNRAFKAASKCFSRHLRISDCLIQQIDDSITMANVHTKPIEQKTNF